MASKSGPAASKSGPAASKSGPAASKPGPAAAMAPAGPREGGEGVIFQRLTALAAHPDQTLVCDLLVVFVLSCYSGSLKDEPSTKLLADHSCI